MTHIKAPFFSVVVPVYSCERSIETLCRQVESELSRFNKSLEIILVDDRSPDSSWDRIRDLSSRNPIVRGVRLSNNFGQQLAITAGLNLCRGEFIYVMDCDLQDEPSLMPKMYETLLEGYDIVLTRRVTRSHALWRRLAAKSYSSIASVLFGQKIDSSIGGFSLISRKVVNSFLSFQERNRHYLYILAWLGFKTTAVEYEQAGRLHGKSTYTLKKLIKHAVDGVIFQSSNLLSGVAFLGFVLALAGGLWILWLIFQALTIGLMPGWASLMSAIILSSGVTLISLATLGLYLGRVFDQVRSRPLYVIDSETP